MNKRIFERVVAVLLVFVMCISTTVMAAAPIRVMINGAFITTDTDPDIINGRTMIPLRAALEALGAKVDWSAETRSATATSDRVTLKIALNSTDVQIVNNKTNKSETFTMDVAPSVVNNRMLVPVRFMATMLGKAVVWDSTDRIAKIIDSTYVYDYFKNNATNLYDLLSIARTGYDFNQSTGEFTIYTASDLSYLTGEESGGSGEIKVNYEFSRKDSAVSLYAKLGLSDSVELQLQEVLESSSDFSEITLDFYCDGEKIFLDSSLLQDESVGQVIKLLTGITSDTSKGIYVTTAALQEKFGVDFVAEVTELSGLDEMIDKMLSSKVTDVFELADFEDTLKFIGYLLSNDNLTKTETGYSFNADETTYKSAAEKVVGTTADFATFAETLDDCDIKATAFTTDGKLKRIDTTFDVATKATDLAGTIKNDANVKGNIIVQDNASLVINTPDFANITHVTFLED